MAKFITRARSIAKSLGMRSAAGYLRNQKVDFAEAHFILLGRAPRRA